MLRDNAPEAVFFLFLGQDKSFKLIIGHQIVKLLKFNGWYMLFHQWPHKLNSALIFGLAPFYPCRQSLAATGGHLWPSQYRLQQDHLISSHLQWRSHVRARSGGRHHWRARFATPRRHGNYGNLLEALTLLQVHSHDAVSSSQQGKDAMGALLQACGHRKDVEIGRKVHNLVFASTVFSCDFVLNTRIITMYAMCGSPLDSRSVFDGLKRKNLFQWNGLVSGYARNKLFVDAIDVFVELINVTEFKPDNFTFSCVFKAYGGISDLGLGQVVHGMAVKMGLISDVFVGNALAKTPLRNKMGDQWLSDSMVVYIERDVFAFIDNESIMRRFHDMKHRRQQL